MAYIFQYLHNQLQIFQWHLKHYQFLPNLFSYFQNIEGYTQIQSL